MSDLHTEAAIWAEGTPYTADELLRGFADYLAYDDEAGEFEWWCENVMKITNEAEASDG